MNSYQKAKFNSYKLIVIERNNNPEIAATILYFDKGVDNLAALLPEIESLSATQGMDLTGITEDKNELAEVVIDYLIEVSGAVHSYAELNGNKALQSLVNYKPTKVVRLDQHDLITAGDIVLKEAQKITDLSNAGISPEELNEFKDALMNLKNSTSNRREAGIDQSGSTKRIAELFSQAENIKKNTLDRLAPQFQRKAPEFYNKYKAAATVIYKRAARKTDTTTPEAKA
ncbi:MAG: hypothetical protein PHR83_01910 [Paludibacter sp.]|nr:hypothetical protein [Paludibacter sp.]